MRNCWKKQLIIQDGGLSLRRIRMTNYEKIEIFLKQYRIGDKILKVSRMNGMKVITADAYTLGEVDGAHADTDTWKITHLDVSLTKEATRELGFRKPMLGALSVCLPITVVKNFGDVITLNKSLKEFKDLKECKGD